MDLSIRVPYYKIVFQVHRQNITTEKDLTKEVRRYELLQTIEQERAMYGQMFSLR
jgi:hypothetical protein